MNADRLDRGLGQGPLETYRRRYRGNRGIIVVDVPLGEKADRLVMTVEQKPPTVRLPTQTVGQKETGNVRFRHEQPYPFWAEGRPTGRPLRAIQNHALRQTREG